MEIITQANVNTVGLIFDIIGAWLVAKEVITQFQGQKYKTDPSWGGANKPPWDSEAYKIWESKKYKSMRIGLIFLTSGFILQIASNYFLEPGTTINKRISNNILENPSFWAIVGIIIGFTLNEISRVIRDVLKKIRLKKVIIEELDSIKFQIDQKIDILNQAIAALKKGDYIATESVPIISIGYDSNINDLYIELDVKKRNCLHVIHSRLKIAEDIMRKFELSFLENVRNKTIKNPFAMSIDRMEELIESYNVVKDLIDSYKNNKPIDVFHVEQV